MKDVSAPIRSERPNDVVQFFVRSLRDCTCCASQCCLNATCVSSAMMNVSGITTIATIWISFAAFAL